MALGNLNNTIAKATNQVAGVTSIANSLGALFGIKGKAKPAQKSDLNQFKSTFLKSGVMRNDRFYVEIGLPSALGAYQNAVPMIPFAAEATNLPGVMLATSEITRFGVGPTQKNPYRPIFVDLSVSFISDGNRIIYDFFYNWINTIVKFSTPDAPKSNFYEVGYRESYVSNITITTVDELNRRIIVIELVDAFPIALGDMPVSWSNSNEYMHVPVTFAYSNWSHKEIKLTESDIKKPSGNLLQTLQSMQSKLNVLSSIRKPRNIGDMASVLNNTNLALGNLGVSKN